MKHLEQVKQPGLTISGLTPFGETVWDNLRQKSQFLGGLVFHKSGSNMLTSMILRNNLFT